MDAELKNIFVELFASEDATGCSSDLTVVSAASIRQLREYVRTRAVLAPVASDSRKHLWHAERSLDGLVHLTLTQNIAALVASALEIVNPESDRQERKARDLALAIQKICR